MMEYILKIYDYLIIVGTILLIPTLFTALIVLKKRTIKNSYTNKKDLKRQIKLLQEEVMKLKAEKEQLERALLGEESNIYIKKK